MAARFNHSHGCQTCGAHPDNPRNHTQKLLGCRDCKSITCTRHLAKPRACPRCNSKRLYVAVRHQPKSFKNKGGVGETGKKGLFGGGGGGGAAQSQKNKEQREKAAHVATEIVKGVGAGVMEALKVLSENNSKNNLPRPEDGTQVIENLHASTHMADGLKQDIFDDIPTKTTPTIGLTDSNDPLQLLSIFAENTLDEAAFLQNPNKKPQFITNAYMFAPNIEEAARISTELEAYNAKNPQKMLLVLAIHVTPQNPEIAEKFSQLLTKNPYLFGSIAISPKQAHLITPDDADTFLTNLLNTQEKILALGPTGFDLHFKPTGSIEQGALLNLTQEIATDFNLPIFLTHKNAEKELLSATQSFSSTQVQLHLTPIAHTSPLLYSLINAEILNEESDLTTIINNPKNIFIGSGHSHLMVLNQEESPHRNTPENLPQMLLKVQDALKEKDINSLNHKLNSQFLKLFHPDLT